MINLKRLDQWMEPPAGCRYDGMEIWFEKIDDQGEGTEDYRKYAIEADEVDLPHIATWMRRAHAELTEVICERDLGAPTERNLATAKFLAEVDL